MEKKQGLIAHLQESIETCKQKLLTETDPEMIEYYELNILSCEDRISELEDEIGEMY